MQPKGQIYALSISEPLVWLIPNLFCTLSPLFFILYSFIFYAGSQKAEYIPARNRKTLTRVEPILTENPITTENGRYPESERVRVLVDYSVTGYQGLDAGALILLFRCFFLFCLNRALSVWTDLSWRVTHFFVFPSLPCPLQAILVPRI